MAWIENKDIIAANINRLLLQKGKTRKEACEDMGIGYSTFTEWANGRKYPRIDKIEMMANYFGVLKSDLIENKPSKPSGVFTYEERSEIVKKAREKKGYSIQALADEAGLDVSVVASLEKNEYAPIKMIDIKTIADILGLNPVALLGLKVGSVEARKSPMTLDQYKLWLAAFPDVAFSDDEFNDIIDYAKYILSKRPPDNQ